MAQKRKWDFKITANISKDNYSMFAPIQAESFSDAFDKTIEMLKEDKKSLPDRIILHREGTFTM